MSLLPVDEMSHPERTSSTSAGGAMRAPRPPGYIIVLFGPRFDFGTAARAIEEQNWGGPDLGLERTTSGPPIESPYGEGAENPAAALAELRRRTGLTWEQLSNLFEVHRRTLHFWASGKSPSAANEERLRRALNAIRAIDRGSASANRVLLFEERHGRIPFDLLTVGGYDEVVELLGRGEARRRPDLPPLAEEEREARKPLPPAVLADARQDIVHRDVGRGRPARTRKARRRGRE